MDATKRKKTVILTVAAVSVAVAAALIFIFTSFVFAAGGMYSRKSEQLDLRGKHIALEDYRNLSEKLPDCRILWDVPFQGDSLDCLEKEIQIVELTQEDVLTLDYLTELETVHAEECMDYALLYQLQQRHPDAEVLYSVPIGGKHFDQSTETLKLNGLSREDATNMGYLPLLKQVSVSGVDDYVWLMQLQQANPQWNLSYTVELCNEEYDWDSWELTLTGVDFPSLEKAMSGLTALKTLNLKNPDAQAQQLLQLREEHPDVQIHWEVELYGQTVADDVKEVDISGIVVESCEEVEQLVACLPELEKLIMSDCGIDNETMAAFRERQRENYKVVWTVYFSEDSKARTDDLYFMPIQQGEYYFLNSHSENLKYCEDMLCLDLGHHPIRDLDFLEYMPHLKYLILAHTDVRDISDIVHCQELIYLEVDWSAIQDYTPIAQLKSLEDLNINRTYCDITPLLEMTWLKNLWAPDRSYSEGQMLVEALPDTHVEIRRRSPVGEGWRNLQNYYDMRDLLGMPYMK